MHQRKKRLALERTSLPLHSSGWSYCCKDRLSKRWRCSTQVQLTQSVASLCFLWITSQESWHYANILFSNVLRFLRALHISPTKYRKPSTKQKVSSDSNLQQSRNTTRSNLLELQVAFSRTSSGCWCQNQFHYQSQCCCLLHRLLSLRRLTKQLEIWTLALT